MVGNPGNTKKQRTLIVFPGQGSQKIGMGADIYESFSCAREVFREVDDAVSFKLSELIFNGSEEELKLTKNAQPAIMAVSMAFVRVLENEFGFQMVREASILAGHSLGEYTALCASGVLSLSDTAGILRLRGQAMADACPTMGAMAAIIGLDVEKVRELVKSLSKPGSVVQVANENSPLQTIVSGHKDAVERVMNAAKLVEAKRVLKLEVSGPFHSTLMEAAAEPLRKKLAGVHFGFPRIPVIANVTAQAENGGFRELLEKQLTSPVRWTETIRWARDYGKIQKVLEIGPGRVLTGLVKQIDNNLETANVNSKESLADRFKHQTYGNTQQSQFF